jgi:hypothetical protein
MRFYHVNWSVRAAAPLVRVEVEHCKPIVSMARFEEYIVGERERPRPRRNNREPPGTP